MEFHPGKCNVLTISRKPNPIKYNCSLHGHTLESVESENGTWRFFWLLLFGSPSSPWLRRRNPIVLFALSHHARHLGEEMENGIPPWQMQCPNNKQETKSNQIQLQSTWTHVRIRWKCQISWLSNFIRPSSVWSAMASFSDVIVPIQMHQGSHFKFPEYFW
jgi:hypothetical protein